MFSTLSALSAPQTKISVQFQSRLPQPPQAVSLDNPQDSVHFGSRGGVRLALATAAAATIVLTASACGSTDTSGDAASSKSASPTATPAADKSFIKDGAVPFYQDNFTDINTNYWGFGYAQFGWQINTNWGNGDTSLNADGQTNDVPLKKVFKTDSNGLTLSCVPITPRTLTNPQDGTKRTFTHGCGSLTSKAFSAGRDGFTVVFGDVNIQDMLGKKVLPALWVISTDAKVEFDLMEHVDPDPNTLNNNFHLDKQIGDGRTPVPPGFFNKPHNYALTVTPDKDDKPATASWYATDDQGKLIKLRTEQLPEGIVTQSTELVAKMDSKAGTPWAGVPANQKSSWTIGRFRFYKGNAINQHAVSNK